MKKMNMSDAERLSRHQFENILFGRGNLMPVFSTGDGWRGILICEVDSKGETGSWFTEEEAGFLAKGGKPLVRLDFPTNSSGLIAIEVLREWLYMAEEIILEQMEINEVTE